MAEESTKEKNKKTNKESKVIGKGWRLKEKTNKQETKKKAYTLQKK